MEAKTRKQINAVLDEATELASAGMDEYAAAREALTAQVTPVLRELAIAAIVDVVRRRNRSTTLDRERAAVVVQRQRSAPPLTPHAAGVRKGSPEYWRWVQDTPEGAAYQAGEEDHAAELAKMIGSAISEYEASIRIRWTAELLDADFTMPDGTRVLWGDATVEQHKERAEMFAQNAAVNVEGAARHLKAVQDLEATGVVSLRELVRSAVAA